MVVKGILLSVVAAVLMVVPQSASALKFTPATGSPITDSGNPISMSAAGDFNGDGRDDVAFGVGNQNGFKVKLSQADGTFTNADPGGLAFGTGPGAGSVEGIRVADVNDDGDLDVLAVVVNRKWQVYLGDGTGQFGANPDSTFSVPYTDPPRYMQPAGPYSATIADLDGDGDLDIAVGMYDFAFDVILGDGDGNFTPQPITYFADQETRGQFDGFSSIAAGDFNGDGDVDLALGMRRDSGVVAPTGVYEAEGNGDGTFTPSGLVPLLTQSYPPASIATVNLDGDSYDDLAVTFFINDSESVDDVFTLLGGPSGLSVNTAQSASLNAGYGSSQMSTADLDGDSRDDIVVGIRGDRKLALLKNNGDGTISPFAGSPVSLNPIDGNGFAVNAVYSGDFNGDGAADLGADSSHTSDLSQARGMDVLISQPNAAPSPSSLDFGMVVPGQASDTQSVTIANSGAAPAFPAQNVTITGTDADQFSLGASTCSGGGQISGNGSCTVGVFFSPTSGGSKSATLHYAMSNQSDIDVPLTGEAGEPQLTVPAGITHLGLTFVGDTATATVTLESTGTAPVTIGTPFVSDNPGQSEFFTIADDECAGETLAPDATCTLDVHFTPTATGFKSTSIGIPSNSGGGGTQYFGIDGNGIDPGISVSPTTYDFGSVEIGYFGTPQTKTFVVNSTGSTNLQAVPISITGDDSDDFSIVGSPSCGVVAPGDACHVEVRFSPQSGAAGPRSGNLVIENNTKDDPVTVPLTGTATVAHVTPTPTSVDFGDVDPYDGTTPTRTVKLQSDGTADLFALAYFGDISAGPPAFESGPFSVDNGACAGTDEDPVATPPGESCDLTVSFDPSRALLGANSETLYLITNGNLVEIPLSADLTQGGATVSSDNVDLGNVEVGQTGSETVTLTSTGTAPLKPAQPVVSGPDADMFSVEQPSSCTGLTAGQSCEVTVEFTPTSIAGKQAYLTLSGNFDDQSLTLNGSGIEAYANLPANEDFGEIKVGDTKTITMSVISNGDAPLNLDPPAIEGADASFFSAQIKEGTCTDKVRGEECGIQITYKPTAAGSHQATLHLSGNIDQSVPLSGSARALTPAKVSLKLSGPRKVKRGKKLVLTAKVKKSGEAASGPLTLKVTVPKRLAKKVKPIKVASIGAGTKTLTRKIRVKVKKSARKGAKLKVKVKLSGPGIKGAEGKRIAKLR